MFLKLFKYDYRYAVKALTPFFIAIPCVGLALAVLVLAIISVVSNEALITSGFGAIFSVIGSLGCYALFFALIVLASIASILLVYNYFKSIGTDEAYLTFTLPVTMKQFFTSKIVTALIFSFITGLLLIIAISFTPVSVLIFYKDHLKDLTQGFKESFKIMAEFFLPDVFSVFLVVIVSIITWVSETLLLYFAVTLGCYVAKKHKLLASIGLVYLANMVVSTISQIFSFLFINPYDMILMVRLSLLSNIILFALIGILSYVFTMKVFKKKLNVI